MLVLYATAAEIKQVRDNEKWNITFIGEYDYPWCCFTIIPAKEANNRRVGIILISCGRHAHTVDNITHQAGRLRYG